MKLRFSQQFSKVISQKCAHPNHLPTIYQGRYQTQTLNNLKYPLDKNVFDLNEFGNGHFDNDQASNGQFRLKTHHNFSAIISWRLMVFHRR